MSDHIPHQGNPEQPHPIDVGLVESTNQRILREAFEATTNLNEALVSNFDPNTPGGYLRIELTTAFPEYEVEEPAISEVKRDIMLRSLGFDFVEVSTDSPDYMFDGSYVDGSRDQIRIFHREDGVDIPVLTSLGPNEAGNRVERVSLMSHDLAAERRQMLEQYFDEEAVNYRLRNEFGINGTILEGSDLGYADKKAMLEAHDAIAESHELRPNYEHLYEVREKLTRNMLPDFKVLESRSAKKLPLIIEEYLAKLEEVMEPFKHDQTMTQIILDDERLSRMIELNDQLDVRRTLKRAGNFALTGVAATVGYIGGGLEAYYAQRFGGSQIAQVVEAFLVGGASGAFVGISTAREFRRRTRGMGEFTEPKGRAVHDDIVTQLDKEIAKAQRFAYRLR